MSKFTASNGIEVWLSREGVVLSEPLRFDRDWTDAIREFFQHERDKELGRWRRPDFPAYVVKNIGGLAHVYNEQSGSFAIWSPEDVEDGRDDWGRETARAYFAAHPIKKPWHTPKHLEIWVLTIRGGYSSEAYIYRKGFPGLAQGFRPVNHERRVTFHPKSEDIVDAHRIWPEGDND